MSKIQATGSTRPRQINEIAYDIRRNWNPVNYAAKPYLDAMNELNSVDDNYLFDSGRSVVAYFLANASSWRGSSARAIKDELKQLIGQKS